MKDCTTLLFDLDGTLTDPKEGITKSIAYAYEQVGITPPPLEELEHLIGPPLHMHFSKIMTPEMVDKAIIAYRYRYDTLERGMYENILYPAIPPALEALQKAGKRLFVATAKAQPIAHKIVAHFGLDRYIERVFGPAPTDRIPDKSGVIADAMAFAGAQAENTIMIGDRNHDMIGAQKCNVRSIGVLWGYGSEQELRDAKADALARQPGDLLPLLTA